MNKKHNSADRTGPESDQNRTSSQHTDSIITGNLGPGSDTSSEHTKPFQLEHPVEDVEDLHGSEYGHFLLREAEADNGVEPGNRSQAVEHSVEQAFDRRVIEITNRVLKLPATDATHGEFPIDDSAVLTLVLQYVRAAPTEDFISHLDGVPAVRKELDVNGELDESTITAWEQELTETDTEAIEACATRVLYAVYRSGQAFPQQVWNATVATSGTGLLTKEDKTRVGDGKIPTDVTQEALRNWAREFLTCIQDEFSLGRDESQTKYPVMSIIGLLAHAALQSRTLTSASKTCSGWYCPQELVPNRTTVMEPIANMSVDAIANVFQNINTQFLQFANEYTILHGSKQLAFDPTSILYYAEDQDDRWLKGYHEPLKGIVESSGADHQLQLGLAAVTEEDVRFALGMYPIKKGYKNDERNRESVTAADVTSRLMRSTRRQTPVSVDSIVMDGELKGADLIRRCRGTVGDNWIIFGPHEDELKRLVADTPQDEPRFEQLEEYISDLSRKPNAFIVPAPHGHRSKHSQWVFLTDLPKQAFLKETDDGDKELDPEIVIDRYQNRCRIEKTLEQIKHDFNIPVRERTDTNVTYFCLNTSMIFYNLHNLINNSISPKFGLPLGKTRGASHGQVLSAIREVAFALAAENKD